MVDGGQSEKPSHIKYRPLLDKYTKGEGLSENIAARLVARDVLGKHRNEKVSEYKELSLIDSQTGLNSRTRLMGKENGKVKIIGALKREFDEAFRYKKPLSLLMIDIDDFKNYNDEYGHPAGDDVLKTIAMTLQKNIRESDEAFRYGGEEITILLPNTDSEHAKEMADRLRAEVEKIDSLMKKVTISTGIASYSNQQTRIKTEDDLLSLADLALYQSKRTGKNKVSSANDLSENQITQLKSAKAAKEK